MASKFCSVHETRKSVAEDPEKCPVCLDESSIEKGSWPCGHFKSFGSQCSICNKLPPLAHLGKEELDPEEIAVIMSETGASRNVAIRALKRYGNIVDAIVMCMDRHK